MNWPFNEQPLISHGIGLPEIPAFPKKHWIFGRFAIVASHESRSHRFLTPPPLIARHT
jgi:hypothetical protein